MYEDIKQWMKGLVIYTLTHDHFLSLDEAVKKVNVSGFAKILESQPEYVAQYSAEYWAEHVIKERTC